MSLQLDLLSVILISFGGALVFFMMQMFFCFKIEKTALKLVPLYLAMLILLAAVFCYAMYLSVGDLSADGYQIFALIFVYAATVALAGLAVAWLLYWLLRRRAK